MLNVVPGTEAALSASTSAAKGARIKKSERKRAHMQMRERELQRDTGGRFKPGQRCTESCYSPMVCSSDMKLN